MVYSHPHYINVVSKAHGVPLKCEKSIHLHSSYLSTYLFRTFERKTFVYLLFFLQPVSAVILQDEKHVYIVN